MVVKRIVSVDTLPEDESLPFLLVVAGRSAGNHQPRIKGKHFFLHCHLLSYIFFNLKPRKAVLFLLGHLFLQDAELHIRGQVQLLISDLDKIEL